MVNKREMQGDLNGRDERRVSTKTSPGGGVKRYARRERWKGWSKERTETRD